MIDLDNEEHRKALLWACENHEWVPEQYIGADKYNAHFVLTDPAQAAELIRRLVERVGASSLFDERELAVSGLKVLGYVFIAWDEWHVWVNECGIPAFIARLLAIVPGAGADAVLAALRGEG